MQALTQGKETPLLGLPRSLSTKKAREMVANEAKQNSAQPKRLRLKWMWLNAENLFLLSDQSLSSDHLKLDEVQWQKLSTSIFENKPLQKTKGIAQIILTEKPDIVALCEVGGLESLQNFNRLFLADTYSCALIEGNSDRNIDLCFLIKKGLPFYFDLKSNRNRALNFLYPHERQNLEVPNVGKDGKTMSHKFSRDLIELHLFERDINSPFFIGLAVHLKSRLDPDFIDPQGAARRKAELEATIDIYQELEKKFGANIPIIILGDFNGNVTRTAHDEEFASLFAKTQLKDVAELANLTPDQSASYYQVNRGKAEPRQLDYCFCSPAAQKIIEPNSVQFYRYKDHLGQSLNPPTDLKEKLLLPSDHYPILFQSTHDLK